MEWEDAVRLTNEQCIALPEHIDAERLHRATLGWVAYADAAVLACLVCEDTYPPGRENAWDVYPRGMIRRVTQVQTGNRLEWADVMDLAQR